MSASQEKINSSQEEFAAAAYERIKRNISPFFAEGEKMLFAFFQFGAIETAYQQATSIEDVRALDNHIGTALLTQAMLRGIGREEFFSYIADEQIGSDSSRYELRTYADENIPSGQEGLTNNDITFWQGSPETGSPLSEYSDPLTGQPQRGDFTLPVMFVVRDATIEQIIIPMQGITSGDDVLQRIQATVSHLNRTEPGIINPEAEITVCTPNDPEVVDIFQQLVHEVTQDPNHLGIPPIENVYHNFGNIPLPIKQADIDRKVQEVATETRKEKQQLFLSQAEKEASVPVSSEEFSPVETTSELPNAPRVIQVVDKRGKKHEISKKSHKEQKRQEKMIRRKQEAQKAAEQHVQETGIENEQEKILRPLSPVEITNFIARDAELAIAENPQQIRKLVSLFASEYTVVEGLYTQDKEPISGEIIAAAHTLIQLMNSVSSGNNVFQRLITIVKDEPLEPSITPYNYAGEHKNIFTHWVINSQLYLQEIIDNADDSSSHQSLIDTLTIATGLSEGKIKDIARQILLLRSQQHGEEELISSPQVLVALVGRNEQGFFKAYKPSLPYLGAYPRHTLEDLQGIQASVAEIDLPVTNPIDAIPFQAKNYTQALQQIANEPLTSAQLTSHIKIARETYMQWTNILWKRLIRPSAQRLFDTVGHDTAALTEGKTFIFGAEDTHLQAIAATFEAFCALNPLQTSLPIRSLLERKYQPVFHRIGDGFMNSYMLRYTPAVLEQYRQDFREDKEEEGKKLLSLLENPQALYELFITGKTIGSNQEEYAQEMFDSYLAKKIISDAKLNKFLLSQMGDTAFGVNRKSVSLPVATLIMDNIVPFVEPLTDEEVLSFLTIDQDNASNTLLTTPQKLRAYFSYIIPSRIPQESEYDDPEKAYQRALQTYQELQRILPRIETPQSKDFIGGYLSYRSLLDSGYYTSSLFFQGLSQGIRRK